MLRPPLLRPPTSIVCQALPKNASTTVGVPWPGFEVRTVTESGADAATGEPGEVVVRGETVTRG